MNPYIRIGLNILAPAPLAVLILSAPSVIGGLMRGDASASNLAGFAGFLGLAIVYAYLLATVPSLLHAVAMEWAYRRTAKPHHWRAVGYSTVSGLLMGALIGGITSPTDLLPLLMLVGAVVGFILGAIIRILSLRAVVNLP